jgi:hypothetical protein
MSGVAKRLVSTPQKVDVHRMKAVMRMSGIPKRLAKPVVAGEKLDLRVLGMKMKKSDRVAEDVVDLPRWTPTNNEKFQEREAKLVTKEDAKLSR